MLKPLDTRLQKTFITETTEEVEVVVEIEEAIAEEEIEVVVVVETTIKVVAEVAINLNLMDTAMILTSNQITKEAEAVEEATNKEVAADIMAVEAIVVVVITTISSSKINRKTSE
jgi:hypothetical protein